uniref:Threonylcarbamoyl-AMP synthase n=1 Tax=Erpetoichthys calabaricus TaxID=27687 RepID=A0A8C4SKF8_ERPCA
MPFVFGAITLTLVFEAVGLFSTWALVVAGVIQLIIVLFGFYAASALLLKGIYQRHVLPGFGNALFDVLLLGAKSKVSQRKQEGKGTEEEKKKNSKYAEPMALGNMSDVISAAILAFYCFRYMPSFQVGVLWVSINACAQLLASYYAYLRKDVFYSTKFALHATYWLVQSWEEFITSVLLKDANVTSARAAMVGGWFFLVAALIFCVLSLNRDKTELMQNVLFALLTISTLPQISSQVHYTFFGVSCSLYAFFCLYVSFVSLINSIAEKALIPLGVRMVNSVRLQRVLFTLGHCHHPSQALPSSEGGAESHTQLPDSLFYLCNGLAAFSALQISKVDSLQAHLSVPWVLIPGTLMQLYVSRMQVQGGRRFGPTMPCTYAAVWGCWTWLRFAGPMLKITEPSFHGFGAAAVAFLVINAFIIMTAVYSNLLLLILTITMEGILVCFLLFCLHRLLLQLEVAFLVLFAFVCAYGIAASLTNYLFEKMLLPIGSSIIQAGKGNSKADPPVPCPTAPSHITSGLQTIARILEGGGVCGIPSDTVYTLAASCKHPAAIERIYNIKERPLEKPICLTIGNLEQLEAVSPPFSPLLWEFMRNVYPGGIGCIVRKGEWLKKLGVGAAYDYVGTRDSIMIRISDLTVTAHLLDMTGPLAITSANPSGQPDSTHHDMVVTRLGHKLNGVLCDGDSTELVSSTVVICTQIDEGIDVSPFCVSVLTCKPNHLTFLALKFYFSNVVPLEYNIKIQNAGANKWPHHLLLLHI